jgi:hypothetical protein
MEDYLNRIKILAIDSYDSNANSSKLPLKSDYPNNFSKTVIQAASEAEHYTANLENQNDDCKNFIMMMSLTIMMLVLALSIMIILLYSSNKKNTVNVVKRITNSSRAIQNKKKIHPPGVSINLDFDNLHKEESEQNLKVITNKYESSNYFQSATTDSIVPNQDPILHNQAFKNNIYLSNV